MKKIRLILVSVTSILLILLNLTLTNQKSSAEIVVQESGQEVRLLRDYLLKNPTFKRGKNNNNQTVIEDWELIENTATVNSKDRILTIGTKPMGYQNNYVSFKNDVYGSNSGVLKDENSKFEVDLTGGGLGETVFIAQTVSTIPGKEYVLSANTWSNTANYRGVYIYDGTAHSGSKSSNSSQVTKLEGDQKISTSFIAKSAQTTMSFRIVVEAHQNARSNISDVELIESVDEAKSDIKIKLQMEDINHKDTLAFDEVPAVFNFGFQEIEKGQQSVTSAISLADSKVSVYKNYARNDEWKVKVNVSNLISSSTSYEVSSFKLNNQEIAGTGADAVILASNNDNNGIGTYSYDINDASIEFKLPGSLETGILNLKGNVFYTLEITKPTV